MIRGRGRGRPARGAGGGGGGGYPPSRGRGRGRGASHPPAGTTTTTTEYPSTHEVSTSSTNNTNNTNSDDPFANITGGGGIGRTSVTAKMPSSHQQQHHNNGDASTSGAKRLPSGGDHSNSDKYQSPPLYPEVAIDKRSVKPLMSEDHFLLSKHRLLRSRNRNSPYMLKREKLYDLSTTTTPSSRGTVRLNNGISGIDNFGLGNIWLTPTYFPLELAQDSLKKVKRVKKKKQKNAETLFKQFGSEDATAGGADNDGGDEEGEEEDEVIVEDNGDDYDFTDDYQYTRNDDDDDMGDDDTLNAAGAGDDGPIIY